jgi:hypothetical protein
LSTQVPCRILRTHVRNIKALTPSATQNGIPFTTETKQLIFVKMMKSARADYHYQLYLRIHIRHFKTLTPSISTTAQNGVYVTTEANTDFCHNVEVSKSRQLLQLLNSHAVGFISQKFSHRNILSHLIITSLL